MRGAEGEGETVSVRATERLLVTVALTGPVPERRGEAVESRESERRAEGEGECVPVAEAAGLRLPRGLPVSCALGVRGEEEGVPELQREALGVCEPVREAGGEGAVLAGKARASGGCSGAGGAAGLALREGVRLALPQEVEVGHCVACAEPHC